MMVFKHIAFLALFAALCGASAENSRIRYDYFDLTKEEQTCWRNSLQRMHQEGTFQKLQTDHGKIGPPGHQTDFRFVMAHMWLLLDWEDEMLKAQEALGCGPVANPYYAMGLRVNQWMTNSTTLFTDDHIGICPEEQQCVTGPFANLGFEHEGVENTCVVRECDLKSLKPEAIVDFRLSMMNTWDKASGELLNGNHIRGHIQVGGHMGICKLSARDVFFWLLHTDVDRLFWHWRQVLDPASKRAIETLPDRLAIFQLTRQLPDRLVHEKIPFYNVTVEDVLKRESEANVVYVNPNKREGMENSDELEWDAHLSDDEIGEGEPSQEEKEKLMDPNSGKEIRDEVIEEKKPESTGNNGNTGNTGNTGNAGNQSSSASLRTFSYLAYAAIAFFQILF